MSNIFDRLSTSSPINRGAGVAVGARGVHYEPKLDNSRVTLDAPPRMRPVPHDAPDLIGLQFGRFRVVGLSAELNGRWVVRCVCGKYEFRTARAIRGEHAELDKCSYCQHLDHLKYHDHVQQFGAARASAMQNEDRARSMAAK
ncbi:MAG: hypothetical protein WC683_18755 [bacterium]